MSTPSIISHGASLAAALALSLAAAPAEAQPIERFLSLAPRALEVRESALSVQQRSDEAQQALGRLLPSLSTRAGYTYNQNEVAVSLPNGTSSPTQFTITPHNQVELSVSVDVPLVDVAGWMRLDAARATRDASERRTELTLEQAQRSIARSYCQWVGASALQRAAQRALEVAQRSLDRARARQQSGAALELDVARAASDVARAQQSLADATLTTQTAARALESLTGLAATSAGLQADSLAREAPLDQWERSASRASSVRQAEADARAQRAQSRAAWWALSPTLNASANERITNAAGFGQPASFSAGVSLSWRIDVTSVANARASDAASATATIRLERALQSARDEIHSAWWQVDAGIARAIASRSRLDAARRATSSARARMAQGTGNEHDVLLAERDEFDAEVSVIQADADLAFARISLRIAAGRALEGGAR